MLVLLELVELKEAKSKPNEQVTVIDSNNSERRGKVLQVMGYNGLERVEVPEAQAGDIICITGIDKLNISDTLCSPEKIEALPPLSVDEPNCKYDFSS
jgi:GTP-binding protein